MDISSIKKPTLLLDEQKAKHNIAVMSKKIRDASVNFRPHFKTHQSAQIGEWFRAQGVRQITVSSVSMAIYFANAGWEDILVAFPVNVRELTEINLLARRIRLHLLVDSMSSVEALSEALDANVQVWIDVGTGHSRTGIDWRDEQAFTALATAIEKQRNISLAGILTYAGNTYTAGSVSAIEDVYDKSVSRLSQVKTHLEGAGYPVLTSIGDTPSASVLKSFGGIDELRPGNFVFYDVTQQQIGSCSVDDIAVGVACPVVSKYHSKQQLVLYCGSVHLSKDRITENNQPLFGRIAFLENLSWKPVYSGGLMSLSQEHGILAVDSQTFSRIQVGDVIVVLPAHSCLTADLYAHYVTLNGHIVPKMRTNESISQFQPVL